MRTRETTKTLIELSTSFEAVDELLNETYCETLSDKIQYLQQMFPVKVIFKDGGTLEDDYRALVHAVLNYC